MANDHIPRGHWRRRRRIRAVNQKPLSKAELTRRARLAARLTDRYAAEDLDLEEDPRD